MQFAVTQSETMKLLNTFFYPHGQVCFIGYKESIIATLWLPSSGAVHCLLKCARKVHVLKA
jgi:hypothetical protein